MKEQLKHQTESRTGQNRMHKRIFIISLIFSIICLFSIEQANSKGEDAVAIHTTASLIESIDNDIEKLILCKKELRALIKLRYVTAIGQATYCYKTIILSAKDSLDKMKDCIDMKCSDRYIKNVDSTIAWIDSRHHCIIASYLELDLITLTSFSYQGNRKLKPGKAYYDTVSDGQEIIRTNMKTITNLLNNFKTLRGYLY